LHRGRRAHAERRAGPAADRADAGVRGEERALSQAKARLWEGAVTKFAGWVLALAAGLAAVGYFALLPPSTADMVTGGTRAVQPVWTEVKWPFRCIRTTTKGFGLARALRLEQTFSGSKERSLQCSYQIAAKRSKIVGASVARRHAGSRALIRYQLVSRNANRPTARGRGVDDPWPKQPVRIGARLLTLKDNRLIRDRHHSRPGQRQIDWHHGYECPATELA
jgi:hypothetical protein